MRYATHGKPNRRPSSSGGGPDFRSLSTVANDQAQIGFARVQLRYTAITSPISVLFTLLEDDFGVINQQMAPGPLTVAVRCG